MLRKLKTFISRKICKGSTSTERESIIQDSVRTKEIYSILPENKIMDLLFDMAIKLNVISMSFPGKYGVIEGSPKDNIIFREYAKKGEWAPLFQTEVVDFIFEKSKGTLLDVGANIGLTAIPAIKNHDIKCLAFEPDPTNFYFLKCNSERNMVTNKIQLFNFALHDATATLEFELSENNLGDHRLRLPGLKSMIEPAFNESLRQTVHVTAKPLDKIIDPQDIEKPILMKVDTQGSELTVLRGAKRTLEKTDFLIIEFSPYHMARMGVAVEDFLKEIKQFPYGSILSLDQRTASEIPDRSKKINFSPIEKVIKDLHDIAQNKHPDNYFDILLSREAEYRAHV